jgi:hypothetical protein
MMEESRRLHPAEGGKPRKRWRRMDQVWDKGIETAPKDMATPPTPARQPERKIIQKSHLLKVQRDIHEPSAICGQLSAISLINLFSFWLKADR